MRAIRFAFAFVVLNCNYKMPQIDSSSSAAKQKPNKKRKFQQVSLDNWLDQTGPPGCRKSSRITNLSVMDPAWLKDKYPALMKPKRKKVIRKVPKKHLTMEQRERIIKLRFGSLDSMYRVHNSMKWIAAKMGVIYSTVVRIISYYVKGGGVIRYDTTKIKRIR